MAVHFRRRQPRQKLVVQPQDGLRVGQHHVAVGGQRHLPTFVLEQHFARNILKALNL